MRFYRGEQHADNKSACLPVQFAYSNDSGQRCEEELWQQIEPEKLTKKSNSLSSH